MDFLMWFLLISIVLLFILISWIWPPHSPWSPWWRTRKKTAEAAFKLSNLKKNQKVFELGSGEATALIVAVEKFGAKGIGIEIDPARLMLSKFTVWRKGFGSDIKLIRGDMFKEDLSEADLSDVDSWDKYFDWLKDTAEKMKEVFSNYI